MTYKVTELPHVCELPDPGKFEYGVEIQCTTLRLFYGAWRPCGEFYMRTVKGVFRRYAAWVPKDWGW